jgi:multidrug resistance protein MdtO
MRAIIDQRQFEERLAANIRGRCINPTSWLANRRPDDGLGESAVVIIRGTLKMALLAQSAPESPRSTTWFREFLKDELTPYPERAALVARMVIAATIVMLITMTFRMPYGAYAALYALTISRESPQTIGKAVKSIVAAFALGGAYVLMSTWVFLGDPLLRLLWVIGSLFASFYAISTMTNYGASSRFGYLIVITIPLWDSHIPTELRVEGTLWAVWAITIASVVAGLGGLVFGAIRPGDELVRSIAERLASVEELLTCYLADRPVDDKTEKRVTRLAMLGTSRLRRTLRRSTYSEQYREQMGAVVVLVGRLVDIAANLTQLRIQVASDDRQRIRALAASIASIHADLLSGRVPGRIEFNSESELSGGVPLLREMEKTVPLIPVVFSGSGPISEYMPSPPADERRSTLFVADALSNPEHLKFGLKGCLAASLCYIIYNSIDWPGISTAITTCLLTALSTVGASRQKQVLRFAGAIGGGVVVGMGAQVFILPYLASIAGFTLLFVVVTGIAAWFATSGPRLSYFGVQFAVAFYLIHLQEFTIQTSLAVARDRVAGILLGLFMMWLVFDQLWSAPAAVEMRRTFISNLRSLGQLVREPLPGREKTWRGDSLRATINTNFDKVRSLADGVLFELGPSRHGDLALRNQIRQLQPQLRTLFVTRIALVKYRLQLPGFELPEPARVAQQQFDDRLARMLDRMADRMEGKPPKETDRFEDAFERLEQTVRHCCSEGPQELLTAEMQAFLALSRSIENVTISLDKEI